MDDKLMPCPFCGSENIETYHQSKAMEKWTYSQCKDCTAIGPDDCEGLNWNTRTALAAQQQQQQQPSAEPMGWLVINADGARSYFDNEEDARGYAEWAHGPRPVRALYERPAPQPSAEPIGMAAAMKALRAEHEEDQAVIRLWRGRCERAEVERDSLRALLAEARDSLAYWMPDGALAGPSHLPQRDLDADLLRRIDAALAKEQSNG